MNIYEFFEKISKEIATMPELALSFIQWSPVFQLIFVSIGLLISFLLAYKNGNVNANLPFISETGAFSPEQCIFSWTLFIGSLVGCVFIMFRYLIISESSLNDRLAFARRNKAALAIGLISMVFLGGVAAFPMTTVFWAHLLTAGVYFVSSAIYLLLSTYTTYEMDGRSKIFILRSILSFNVCLFQLLMIIIFPIALTRWKEHHQIIPALKTPSDDGFILLLISAFLEWSIVCMISAFHITFVADFRIYELSLKAKKVGVGSDAAEVPL